MPEGHTLFRLARDLDAAWEVLAEAIQTALRAAGIPNGYELLKEFSRGRRLDGESVARFIDGLPLDAAARASLRSLTPAGYSGLAARLASEI